MKPIIAIAEEFDGDIRKGSLQAVAEARRIAAAAGSTPRVLCVGANRDASAQKLAAIGVASVEMVTVSEATARHSGAIAAALAKALESAPDAVIVASHSDLMADVAPRLAQRLGAAYIADATASEIDGGTLRFTRPIYAGKALEKIDILAPRAVVTFRANAFPTPALNGGAGAQVVDIATASAADLKALVREIVKKSGLGTVSLTEADIIVSGGIGVGGPEGYEPLKKLCAVLGAALGASRAAVHAGWISPDNQVGQTGKTVSPNLYVACGISGAIQHQAGMRTSRCIVAINTDPNAPIFQIAHYGIVGDVHQVVPALTEEFKKALAG